MQEVHLTCSAAAVPVWVNTLQQQLVDTHTDVALIDFGCSYKRHTGYVVLCWAGRADQAIVEQLQAEPTIEDLSIYTIPESGPGAIGKGYHA